MAIGVLAMSASERERLKIVAQVAERVVSQRVAAERLGICLRQVRRLVRAYRESGDVGLLSRQRGGGLEPSARLGRLRAGEGTF